MKLDIGIPAKSSGEYRIPPNRAVNFVRRAEEYGFRSVWTIEHLTRPRRCLVKSEQIEELVVHAAQRPAR